MSSASSIRSVSSCWGMPAPSSAAVPSNVVRLCFMPVSRRSRTCFVEALLEGVPGQGGALDADGELHDPLEGGELAEALDVELRRLGRAVGPALELGLVDRHEGLEGPDERLGLAHRLALDRRA